MTAIIAAKEGICVKKFVIKLGVVHSRDNAMKIYYTTILSTCFNPKELKVTPKDQICTKPSH